MRALLSVLSTIAILCTAALAAPIPPSAVESDGFLADVSALCASPHRIAGTAEGRAAAAYLEKRLRDMGIADIMPLDMPVTYPEVSVCRLTIDSTTAVDLLPVAPNLIFSPVTKEGSVSGPLVYLGTGASAASIEGAIAVLEYDSYDAWKKAFMMGAKAVLFLGSPSATPWYPKHVSVPGNLIRLYVPPQAQSVIDLRKDYPQATLTSHIPWKRGTGRNLLAFLPGANPKFVKDRTESEMMVMSANYDTWGEIPQGSPGARSAANLAAVLQALRYFKDNRPKRDMLFMFVDNQSQYHQGSYAVYDAITRDKNLADKLAQEHQDEVAYLRQVRDALANFGTAGAATSAEVFRRLMDKAENSRNDLKQKAAQVRLEIGQGGNKSPALTAERDRIEAEVAKWDNALKALARNSSDGIEPQIIVTLKARTDHDLARRVSELVLALAIDAQEKAIREKLSGKAITLHVSYNFSDQGPVWGPVAGDASEIAYCSDTRSASWDNPGHYGLMMRAIREAVDKTGSLEGFDRDALKDASLARNYVPGNFICSNVAAGNYGFYNLSFMTYHDRRARDGHPADVVSALGWQRIRAQAHQATRLMGELANSEAISLPPAFTNISISEKARIPRWNNGKSSGYAADLMISGSLAENSPATDAIIAILPQAMPGLASSNGLKPEPKYYAPDFNRFVLEQVDGNGKFKITGVNRDIFLTTSGSATLLASTFDSIGAVEAIVNSTTWTTWDRLKLFPAKGYMLSYPLAGEVTTDADTKVLQASANAPFRQDKSLSGGFEGFIFFYVHRYAVDDMTKVFQPYGAAFLGASRDNPYGKGFPIATFEYPPAVDRISAEDLWELNETRLSLVRTKGVTDVDLEVLHNRARQYQEKALTADRVETKQSLFAQSAQVSRRVYQPVKLLMNDLVQAIVILLLLAIPFAFGLERLLICASTIYGRLSGFVVFFLLTFIALYLMHPGFSIAATPIIVFLAFAIIVLTAMVIYIMMRKFRVELMAFQGKVTSMHNVEISRMGTMMAAVNMGMSTMRRRPIRTLLTCITVIMLTFTILCFASLSNRQGVRAFYVGPVAGNVAGTFLVHRLDYQRLNTDLLNVMSSRVGDKGLCVAQWWKVKIRGVDNLTTIARCDNGRMVSFDGVMGVAPEELAQWDALASLLEGDSVAQKQQRLQSNGIYLPVMIREQLKLAVGDSLWIDGRKAWFAGTTNSSKLQEMKHLDGRSVLPVNFLDEKFGGASGEVNNAANTGVGGSDAVQRDFTRLNANQVAIASGSLVSELGGTIHCITIYPDASVDAAYEGRRLAEVAGLSTPVWTKTKTGVDRLIFTKLTEVTGIYALIIPVLLGGFIIFGTLLGSITDRQKEIYTFSALGLSPGHVGFLFLAEACVYAVIGGLGGQLLAQALALFASYLASLGVIQQPSINFSSTNSIFAIITVMITVLLSSIYPAIRASKSANPGVQRSWKMPAPVGGVLAMKFPFTVSSYDITGVVSFLSEHFGEHGDSGLGSFSAQDIKITRDPASGNLTLSTHLYLAPFDLGISQTFSLTATPSEISGIDEIAITATHLSGSLSDWKRSNKVFLRDLRRQFLLWRTLSSEVVESYRQETLAGLGEGVAA